MPHSILSYRDSQLFRSDVPHRILAGAIHYFRVHPDQWEDRLLKLQAMGANTVDTYVAWNFHQPKQDGAPDFTGWRDLGAFIDTAARIGLDVIVRPGPYICAEWDNGGFPAWLTGTPGIGLRCMDPEFTAAIEAWFDELLPIIVPRQAAHGGPVVAVQIENEYGSYGDDQEYLKWNRQALQERGITELLFTADGGTDYFLDGGAMEDTWATATLGSRGDEAIETWQRRRPGEPFFNVEFWGGWFDHWGEEHHVRDVSETTEEVRKILDLGGSICLYMAHGGTNFGLRSGANHDGKVLQPTVTSYDSDAPIAENGALTGKFHALRGEFFKAQGIMDPPPLPRELLEPAPVLPAQSLSVVPGKSLLSILRSAGPAVSSVRPQSFEQLGLDAGMVLYSANPVLPGKPGEPAETPLRILGLADRAHVWVDGEFAGVLDDQTAADGLMVTGTGARIRLEILVENRGRINYGPLTGQGKGILDGVLVNQRRTFNWTHVPIALDEWETKELELLSSATLEVQTPADTFLALPGFGMGFVWVNGFLLGRYEEAGPQVTLYVPAPLLHSGTNRIQILELGQSGTKVELREEPDLGAPSTGKIAAAEL
ncbi:glycoside hydrolase family 35 protein [Pseudarthrobacter sp. J64]|uniref:glycoside hydrolase family 35 protein n=1 Tax=Pseudarthrobacter sp. J64 TaxID=3116485 RepID=UPI002E80E227|nr:glycoside hydrolase family 35 protein [Pseudarthrobacter sp. J64]MEE2569148.1 glycoside hydrolase family 35 protein [Pseudarthrobacter sp. J64]